MKQFELDNALNQGKEFNAILLYGQSDYLVSKYAKKIIAKYDGADIQRVYFDEYNFEHAKNFLAQNSLFGDKLILYVMTDKKIDKKECEELARISQKNNGLFFVHFTDDLAAKDSAFVNVFSSKLNACEVRFFAPNRTDEVMRFVANEAREKGISIKPDALKELLDMQNWDLEFAVAELDKFTYHHGEIDIAQVRLLAGENDQTEMDKLLDEVFMQKPFGQTLEHLLEKSGFDEIRVALSLQYMLYELYQIFLRSRAGLGVSAKEVSGKNTPDFIWKTTIAKALKYKESQYKNALQTILDCEYELKTMKGQSARLILASNLLKFQSALK